MIKAKKHLGQHFLIDNSVIDKIVSLIQEHCAEDTKVVEVGPGPGILTDRLIPLFPKFKAIEFDRDMIKLLVQKHDPSYFINEDFLSVDLKNIFDEEGFNLVGNFPYNISSQIIFKMLDNVSIIPTMVGMFQREVAERICSAPGSKKNGILSLRAQAHYEATKIFDIPPEAFSPAPRVWSSIIVLKRKEDMTEQYDKKVYKLAIKTAFQQRRKMLRNTLKPLLRNLEDEMFKLRPEALGVKDFIKIAKLIEKQNQNT